MLRVQHNQTVVGGILVDDIDDGLPNKTVYRLGSQGDPKAYKRDGYAQAPKQSCYIAFNRTTQGYPSVPGYIDLDETPRVLLSSGEGRIFNLQKAELVTVTSLTASQVAAPVVTAASHSSSSNASVTGTTLTSVSPDTTTVTFAAGTATAPSPAVWTQAQILAATGTVSATSITIPLSAFSTAPSAGNTVTVNANEQNSNTFTLA
jgi:hypothetical protein